MFPTKKSVLRTAENFFYQCYNTLLYSETPAGKESSYKAAILYRDALLMDYPKHKDTITECWNNFKPVFVERLKEVGVEVE
jgi:hypothetical protein